MTKRPTRDADVADAPSLPDTFGQNFRERRSALGVSQSDVARRSGVKQTTISAIEGGKHRNLELATMTRLAEAVDCDLAVLLQPRSSP